jgi:N-acetylglucosaminyl-diphospho-decaprenol L-rhamnosyltransferase
VHDLAIIVVSTNEGRWLTPCLETVLAHVGSVDVDVVVADNESTDGTRELVEARFPEVRVVTCPNHGFSHANNRGWKTCDARYALFLNPDTEILDGTFEELVAAMDARPEVGLVGVKQVTADGRLFPTIRRAPHALRTLAEALGSERFPVRSRWLGERELDFDLYDTELNCDWTSGSFMLARREALESAGLLDERFFIYSEETDLCHRIRKSGWEVRHLPTMTILHHALKAGINLRMEAQAAYARRQFARKNLGPIHRVSFLFALGLRHALRAAYVSRDADHARQRRRASRLALRTLVGLAPAPFGPPPRVAVAAEPTEAAAENALTHD